jgi:hypothetical protein
VSWTVVTAASAARWYRRQQSGNTWKLSAETAWSAETEHNSHDEALTVRTSLTDGTVRLIYSNELPTDRDRHGFLWHRVAWNPGQGRPHFAQVHTQRQRRTMRLAQCQVCMAPANLWMSSAVLWAEHVENYSAESPYPTFDPPVCRNCANVAAAACPHLVSQGFVFLAPRTWANTAIRGQVLDPNTGLLGEPRTVPLPGAVPPPDPALLRLTLAKGLMSSLFDVTAHRGPDAVSGLGARRGHSSAVPLRNGPLPGK